MIPTPMVRISLFLCVFYCLTSTVIAQNIQHPVFPELSGQTLLDELVANYKTKRVLNYGQARDTLFAIIDNVNDSLECVYTGFTIYLDPTDDPTRAAYKRKINTEHTYPQNKGAKKGNAKSDMHHLYAVRVNVNSTRGNLPFKQLEEQRTKRWYINERTIDLLPQNNKGDYSKWDGSFFEPRDVHKGNLARAIFYFYTMYKEQADQADPEFFSLMTPDLCKWHELDPVDFTEWNRNQAIADYQKGKLNPFILDPSLPARTYCSSGKGLVGPPAPKDEFPKPYFIELHKKEGSCDIQYFLQNPYQIEVGLYNEQGRLLNDHLVLGKQDIGFYVLDFDVPEEAAYIYVILQNEKGNILEQFRL